MQEEAHVAQRATVLIVDDEARTRELERRILETGPYTVLEASGASEAFEIVAAGQTIDLLISDLEMPGLSGEEMVAKIRSMFPGQKILYVSGVVDRLSEKCWATAKHFSTSRLPPRACLKPSPCYSTTR